jgi:hypothetical protein
MSAALIWYVARAGGIVAWALAAASVLWGLAFSSRAFGSRPRPAWLFDLHRFLGGLALLFTAIHVLAVLADSYVRFTLVNLLVPLTGDWHPVAVAWGVVALYLLVAVELTALARARLPRNLWRRLHYASFAVFAMTTIHALTAGTDTGAAPFRLAVVASCVAVAGLAAVRLSRSMSRGSRGSTSRGSVPRGSSHARQSGPPGAQARAWAPARPTSPDRPAAAVGAERRRA